MTRARAAALLFSLAAAACQPAKPAPSAREPAPAAPEAQVPSAPVERSVEHYGAPFASEVPEVPLASLIADPAPYAGRIIETEGRVSQVCQAAGCWMELAAAGTSERVRTPMAGHAFFLPKDVVGKKARVQGRVELIALSPEMKQHLEAEGAQATSGTLSLSALSVAVR